MRLTRAPSGRMGRGMQGQRPMLAARANSDAAARRSLGLLRPGRGILRILRAGVRVSDSTPKYRIRRSTSPTGAATNAVSRCKSLTQVWGGCSLTEGQIRCFLSEDADSDSRNRTHNIRLVVTRSISTLQSPEPSPRIPDLRAHSQNRRASPTLEDLVLTRVRRCAHRVCCRRVVVQRYEELARGPGKEAALRCSLVVHRRQCLGEPSAAKRGAPVLDTLATAPIQADSRSRATYGVACSRNRVCSAPRNSLPGLAGVAAARRRGIDWKGGCSLPGTWYEDQIFAPPKDAPVQNGAWACADRRGASARDSRVQLYAEQVR